MSLLEVVSDVVGPRPNARNLFGADRDVGGDNQLLGVPARSAGAHHEHVRAHLRKMRRFDQVTVVFSGEQRFFTAGRLSTRPRYLFDDPAALVSDEAQERRLDHLERR